MIVTNRRGPNGPGSGPFRSVDVVDGVREMPRHAGPGGCRSRDDAECLSPLIVADQDRWLPYLHLATPRIFPRGHTIIQQGAFVSGVYHLTHGRVQYAILSPDGRLKVVALLEPGNVIGDGPTIIGRPCAFTVTAVTECEVHFFPAKVFHEILENDPAIIKSVCHSLARKLRALASQVSELTFLDARTRVARLIDTFSSQRAVMVDDRGHMLLDLDLTHTDIGHITGNDRVTVTKALGDLEDLGCIEIGKRSIRIRDRTSLARLAAPGRLY